MSRKWVLVAVVVVLAGVAGFAAQRLLADRPSITTQDSRSAAATAEVGRQAATARGPEAPPPEATSDADAPSRRPIPETIPAIALPDREGVSRRLTDWIGRPVLINFWATWCGPCRDEIPLLKRLRKDRQREGLEVVGIAIDQREAVLEYAREIGIDYPILIGEKEGYAAAEAFGVAMVLPFSVFADRKGRIVTVRIGELHGEDAAFILDRVADVDGNRLELPTAREQIAAKLRELAVERARRAADSHDHGPDDHAD